MSDLNDNSVFLGTQKQKSGTFCVELEYTLIKERDDVSLEVVFTSSDTMMFMTQLLTMPEEEMVFRDGSRIPLNDKRKQL